MAYPRLSNFDDFLPLERQPAACVRFVERATELASADLVILPGSKSTLADLDLLRTRGFADAIAAHVSGGGHLLGICGGYQMLGARLDDPSRVESDLGSRPGLGLLAVGTRFFANKQTRRVEGVPASPCFLTDLDRDPEGLPLIRGYEIHSGRVRRAPGLPPLLRLADGSPEGAVGRGGAVVGTLVHGLFDNPSVTRSLLRALWLRRGLAVFEQPLKSSR